MDELRPLTAHQIRMLAEEAEMRRKMEELHVKVEMHPPQPENQTEVHNPTPAELEEQLNRVILERDGFEREVRDLKTKVASLEASLRSARNECVNKASEVWSLEHKLRNCRSALVDAFVDLQALQDRFEDRER